MAFRWQKYVAPFWLAFYGGLAVHFFGWMGALGAMCVFALGWWLFWRGCDPATLQPCNFPFDGMSEKESNEMAKKPYAEKFCIIGAGYSGLGVAAAMVRRRIPFDILEAENTVGGNWSHGVYENVNIISSKLVTEYKDMRMPDWYPDFPSSKQVCAYLADYCEHFGLRKHIHFNSAVQCVRPVFRDGTVPAPAKDMAELFQGRKSSDVVAYDVTLRSGETRRYKGVVVCNGHHWDKRMPKYPGNFTGQIMHSKDYRTPDILRGKRILVIGAGNSGCDLAVESARFGEQSHTSHRRGYWFIPRTAMGIPMTDWIQPWMPMWAQKLAIVTYMRLIVGPNTAYGLDEPDHLPFDHHPTVNSELLNYIKLGRIFPHNDIARFEGSTVHFQDGSSAEIDLILACTGYEMSIPVLGPDMLRYRNGTPQLLAGFMTGKFRNLYVFGMGQVRYGAGPCITIGAESICDIIQTQEKMRAPIGAVLQKLGMVHNAQRARKCNDILIDPYKLMMSARGSRWAIPWMPMWENILSKLGVRF